MICSETDDAITLAVKKKAQVEQAASDEGSAIRQGVDQQQANGFAMEVTQNLELRVNRCPAYPKPIDSSGYESVAAYCWLAANAGKDLVSAPDGPCNLKNWPYLPKKQ